MAVSDQTFSYENAVTNSLSPPSSWRIFLVVFSCHWYIATCRCSRIALIETPNSSSVSWSGVVAVPVRCMKRPSFCSSTCASDTCTAATSPSRRAWSVATACPSFQRKRANEARNRMIPAAPTLTVPPARRDEGSEWTTWDISAQTSKVGIVGHKWLRTCAEIACAERAGVGQARRQNWASEAMAQARSFKTRSRSAAVQA